jgi:DMSO/TMAO reductase YedYZ molybdopterin-dependent catalytic subunit
MATGAQGGLGSRLLTGLGAGALMAAALLAANLIGALPGLPNVAFSVFEWLTRVLPGRLVIFGLETTLRALEAIGFNIKDTAKTVEEVLALTGLFVTATLIATLFFVIVRTDEGGLVRRYGLAMGAALGVTILIIVLAEQPPNAQTGTVVVSIWVIGQWVLWGLGVGRLCEVTTPPPGLDHAQRRVREARQQAARAATAQAASGQKAEGDEPERSPSEEPGAPQAEALPDQAGAEARRAAEDEAWVSGQVERLDRRRFIIRVGGLAAVIAVAGAELAEVLSVEGGLKPAGVVKAPIPFPNADSPVKPVPGTRPEYTAPADHYRVDIDLSPPQIDEASWQLQVAGLVPQPRSFTLQQLKAGFPAVSRFITLSCISNPVGGPLIGTTLWTGLRFRDLLAAVQPLPEAKFAHMLADDGFDEIVDLPSIRDDSRVMLVYAWNGRPLLAEHGFPLRLYRPGRYGMKQPKWITQIVFVRDDIQGYWVERGWDALAVMKTTSVIDVVGSDQLDHRGGQTLVPVGGIAHAGDRGISKVEVRVDDGPWESAELRQPLSGLTWVIWRYEWPFVQGTHVFAVRAYDGTGTLQTAQAHGNFPSGATGIDTKSAELFEVKS